MEFDSVGARGYTVTPYLRKDRGDGTTIYFRWTRRKKSANGKAGGVHPQTSGMSWPTNRREQRKREDEIERRAHLLSEGLRQGLSDEALADIALGRVASPPPSAGAPPRTWTIAEVFAECIGPSPRGLATTGEKSWTERTAFWRANPPSRLGAYKTGWTPQGRQARREADKIEDLWGANTPFRLKKAPDLNLLWTAGVKDNAVKRLEVALWASGWLATQLNDPTYTVLALPKGWKREVALAVAGPRDLSEDTERYEPWEAGEIWRLVLDPTSAIPPMIRLLVHIGGEIRLGQLLRATSARVQEIKGMYYITPPQAGNKKTGPILVPALATAEFVELLHAARQRKDRRLFPMERHGMSGQYRALENAAGVRPLGAYALRKTMIDLAPLALMELTTRRKRRVRLAGTNETVQVENSLAVGDRGVLEVISHHRPSGTKDEVYRDTPVGEEARLKLGTPRLAMVQSAATIRDWARQIAIREADAWRALSSESGEKENVTPE